MDWGNEYRRVKPLLEGYKPKAAPPKSVLKANQVDALEIDDQTAAILREQYLNGFKLFGEEFLEKWKPEFLGIFNLLLFKYTVWDSGSTYGQRLQNFSMTDRAGQPLSKTFRFVLGIFEVGGVWLWQRLSLLMTERNWAGCPPDSRERTTWLWFQRIEKVLTVGRFLNILAFLAQARYPSLLYRLLSVQFRLVNPSARRQISLDFMNRQIEFLAFLLPLVNLKRLKFLLSSWLGLTSSSPTDRATSPKLTTAAESCGLCQANPLSLPYRVPCGHAFDYYCLAERCHAGTFRCPQCGAAATLADMQPVHR